VEGTEPVSAKKGPIRRFDEGVATGEATILAVTLLLMIFFALLQAILGRMRDAGIQLANDLIDQLHWIDPFLQVCMVWISFLGASLAAHHNKHIGVDVVIRMLPRRVRPAVEGVAKVLSGAVAVVLALVFWAAVMGFNSPETLDYEYSVMSGSETVHICDASEEVLRDQPEGRPALYCAIRGLLGSFGARSQTPLGASMMIMPVAFLIIGARFLGQGVVLFLRASRKREDTEPKTDGEA
jgi:TRAP-type C4-dicarboxylate transport system permease small subunit